MKCIAILLDTENFTEKTAIDSRIFSKDITADQAMKWFYKHGGPEKNGKYGTFTKDDFEYFYESHEIFVYPFHQYK